MDKLGDCHSVLQVEHFVRLDQVLAVVLELLAPLQELFIGDNDLSWCRLLGWSLLLLLLTLIYGLMAVLRRGALLLSALAKVSISTADVDPRIIGRRGLQVLVLVWISAWNAYGSSNDGRLLGVSLLLIKAV